MKWTALLFALLSPLALAGGTVSDIRGGGVFSLISIGVMAGAIVLFFRGPKDYGIALFTLASLFFGTFTIVYIDHFAPHFGVILFAACFAFLAIVASLVDKRMAFHVFAGAYVVLMAYVLTLV